MNNPKILSFIGGSILCINTWPQIYKAYKTKSTHDLSYLFLFFNIFGLSLMMSYGILINDISLYIPMLLSICNTCLLLSLKYFYDNK